MSLKNHAIDLPMCGIYLFFADTHRKMICHGGLVRYFYTTNKKNTMLQEINNDNRIFIYALSGALLFIGTLVFSITNAKQIANFELLYNIVAGLLTAVSVSLLYKAIKSEQYSLKKTT